MNRTWVQTGRLTVVLAIVLVAAPVALGQSPGVGETTDDAAAQAIVQQEQTPSADQALGILAVDRAAKANKYAFVFFFRADDERTRTMRAALETAVGGIPDEAAMIAVDVTDPLEKAMVNKFEVSRVPMPLILAVAPTGAITKVYNHRKAAVTGLHDATLDIPAGDFVVVVGPSGSGKSTLLLMLGGMLSPTNPPATSTRRPGSRSSNSWPS